jgi:hypothetical protein
MARVATKFDDHKDFGILEQPEVAHADLTSEVVSVVASDKDSKRSGEVKVTVYALADGVENPLEAILALFGGSQAELAKFALGARNDSIRNAGKDYVRDSILGPEKKMAQVIARVARGLKLDVDTIKAKVAKNPAYLDMLLELAKNDAAA